MSEHETRRRPEIGRAPATGRTQRRNWAARHDLLLYFAYLLSLTTGSRRSDTGD